MTRTKGSIDGHLVDDRKPLAMAVKLSHLEISVRDLVDRPCITLCGHRMSTEAEEYGGSVARFMIGPTESRPLLKPDAVGS